MKNEILMFYKQLRQSKITVNQARRLTAEKFGISILLVVSIVTGINYWYIYYTVLHRLDIFIQSFFLYYYLNYVNYVLY